LALRNAKSRAAEATLTAAIDDSTTTIPCSPANLAAGDYLNIGDELMGPITSLGGSSVTVTARGVGASDPAEHGLGAKIYVVLAAEQVPTVDQVASFNAASPALSGSNAVVSEGTLGFLNVRSDDYGATGDGTTDDVAAINSAIAAASSLASSLGLRQVTVGGFGRATYCIKGSILAKPNVRLELGEAKILLGKDLSGSATETGMVFTHQVSNAAANIGTADLTSGSYVLTNVSQIESFYPEQRLGTVTGIPADTKVKAVDVANNKVILDAACTGSATGRTIQKAATYYGNYSDFSIIGGEFDPNGYSTYSTILRLIYTENLVLDGVRVNHNLPSGHESWAFGIGGRNFLLTNCKVFDGDAVYEDGIHVMHGQGGRIVKPYIESGDDALAFGGEPSDTVLAADPDPVRNITVTAPVVKSQRAHALRCYVQSGQTGRDWEVTDITVDGMVGSAGILRNGGISIEDNNAGAPGTTQIRRIKVRGFNLDVGSKGHDDVGTPVGINVLSASDVEIDGTMRIAEKESASTGMRLGVIQTSEIVGFKVKCPALATPIGVAITSSNGVRVKHGTELIGATSDVIYISHSKDFDIEDGVALRNIASGKSGVVISSLSGKLAKGRIGSVVFQQATSGATGVTAAPGSHRRLLLDGCDFREVSTPVSSTLLDPITTQVNNGAGYTSSDTDIVVDDGSKMNFGDLIRVPRTGEVILVGSVSSNTVTGVRGNSAGLAAAALLDNDYVEVRNVTAIGCRGLRDYQPHGMPEDMLPGIIAFPQGGQPSNKTLVAGQRYIVRFVPKHDRAIRSICFGLQTAAGSNDNVDVGIYDATGTLLVSSGSTAGKLNGSTGTQSVAITETIVRAKTIYYAALQSLTQGSTAAVLAGFTMASAQNNQIAGTGFPHILSDVANGGTALPNTYTIGTVSSTGVLLYPREW
jgi:polygalacturonase